MDAADEKGLFGQGGMLLPWSHGWGTVDILANLRVSSDQKYQAAFVSWENWANYMEKKGRLRWPYIERLLLPHPKKAVLRTHILMTTFTNLISLFGEILSC